LRTERAVRPSALTELGQAIVGLGVTYGAWALYAALFGFQGASLADLTPGEGPKDLSHYVHLLVTERFHYLHTVWIDQFWGDFAWVNTPLPAWIQRILFLLTLAAIAVLLVWTVVVVRRIVGRWRNGAADAIDAAVVETWAKTLVCVLAVASTFAFFVGLGFLNFRRTGRNDLILGRYALMLIPAMLAAPTLALGYLWRRLNPAVPMVMAAGAMAALNIGAIVLVVDRFYL
jgi:hypothetical protein